jgi:hypothetical protein
VRGVAVAALLAAGCATLQPAPAPTPPPVHRVLTLEALTPPLGTALNAATVLHARLSFAISPMEADEYLIVALLPTRDGLAWGPRAHVVVSQPAGQATLDLRVADLVGAPLLATPLRIRFALLARLDDAIALPVAQTEPVTLTVANARRQRDASLMLDLRLDDDLVDRSPAHHSVDPHGVVGFNDGSMQLTGNAWLVAPTIHFDGPAFAASLWIAPDDEATTYGLVDQRDARAPDRHLRLMVRDGRPCLGFSEDDLWGARTVPPGEWTHLVFQYREGQQEIWMDGRLIGQRATGPYRGRRGDTLIGQLSSRDELGHEFRGRLRGLRVYRRGLSPREVAALYREGDPPALPVEHGPSHTLHVHAIRTSNDDGSDETVISPGQVMRWVRKTNQILDDARAGIRLSFDDRADGPDWELVRDSAINHMGNGDREAKAHANRIALRHPDKLVFFFRYAAGRGEHQNRGNGFAGTETQFIALPAFDQTGVRSNVDDQGARRQREAHSQNIWQMAHDLGHFLGLPHTFAEMPGTPAQLARLVADNGLPIFDGDGIPDTAPDVGPDLFVAQHWNFCGETSSLVALPDDGSFLRFPLANARNNVMSYFACEPMGFTPGQVRVMRRTLESPDRRRLWSREPLQVFRGSPNNLVMGSGGQSSPKPDETTPKR